MHSIPRRTLKIGDRALIGGLVFVVLVLIGAEMAHATEIMPSIGVSHPTNGGDSKLYTGIALRNSLAPFVQTDLSVAYRKEEFSSFGATATTWPVTASVWLAPIPFAYAGGGVGWYPTSFSYQGAPAGVALAATDQRFGTHWGGGLRMPLAPMLGLDLNARYVVLQDKNDSSLPSNYNPEFWSMALGLGFKF